MKMNFRVLFLTFASIFVVCLAEGEVAWVNFNTTEEREPRPEILLGFIRDLADLSSCDQCIGQNTQYDLVDINPSDSWDVKDFYQIDASTSELSIKQKLDREEFCPKQPFQEEELCYMVFNVIIVSGSIFNKVGVRVLVEDVNDKSPEFPQPTFALTISEGTSVDTAFSLPVASDQDIGRNGNVTYELRPQVSTFQLRVERGGGSTASEDISLVLKQLLDRETTEIYQLYVFAYDGGSPPKSGVLTVNITVQDVNDNRPSFNPRLYNVTVNENEEQGKVIVQLTATDRDIGNNGKLSYYISQGPSSILSSLQLNETTGQISVNGELQFDPSTPDPILVGVRDNGVQPKSAQVMARVIINIIDTSNSPPVMTLTVLFEGKVKEDVSINTTVALLTVTDTDGGENGQFYCTSSNSAFGMKRNTATSYNIITEATLDREDLAVHDVTISCADRGSPPLNASEAFQIFVIDVNDNDPVFNPTSYSGEIVENNDINDLILTVSATDRDAGLNGQVDYRFLNGNQPKFILDGNRIRASTSFDREGADGETYNFVVIAVDKGDPPRSTSASVTVTILDENDQTPTFTQTSYTFSVLEGLNISTRVDQVAANDGDKGSNGTVRYEIPVEYSNVPFQILEDGGIITAGVLDREKVNQWTFEIRATDSGTPPRSSSVQVTINVDDINDNEPYITFPNSDNNTVSVFHTMKKDTVLTQIIAEDIDDGDNKKLSFYIEKGNDDDYFRIEESNGKIILNKDIDRSDLNTYNLIISVRDNGNPQFSNRGTIHMIFLLDSRTEVATGAVGNISRGQNILIAISISCVTFVLSVVIIIIICIIKRHDKQRRLFDEKEYDQQKIMSSSTNRSSNRSNSSKGSIDKMMGSENGYQVKKNKKEVSFSLDEEVDGQTVSPYPPAYIESNSMSTFKSSPEPGEEQIAAHSFENVSYGIPPVKKNDEADTAGEDRQRDIHRMTSLRVHQVLLQNSSSNNNNNHQKHNNNSKDQWPHNAQDEHTKHFLGLMKGLDDSQSESTTSDSGRGGSEEDIRSSTTNSNDTEELRGPASPSHPFYTHESQQPTFSSFRGSGRGPGPSFTSFQRHVDKKAKQDPIQMKELNSGPNMDSHFYGRDSEMNNLNSPGVSAPSPQNFNYPPNFRSKSVSPTHRLDSDPLLRTSRQNTLNFGQSFEGSINGSLVGTLRSHDDDDTTTSGSYTLNNDDICTEISDTGMFYKPDTFV